MATDRILIISHGHPHFSKGGAEIAAYNLFQEYKKMFPDNVLFLARHPRTNDDAFPIVQLKKDEILFLSNTEDYFTYTQPRKELLWQEIRELIEQFKPTIVHFHHYIHIGIELLRIAKNISSKPSVFLTLHEYSAICNNNGQMVKTGDRHQLCYQSSPVDCHQCFNSTPAGEFLLREYFIKSFFEITDRFISPSIFLKKRYVAWGIPESKISVIENGQHIPTQITERNLTQPDQKIRFGYFGQLNPYKGIDILIDAFQQLPKHLKKQVHLDIYGANLEIQSPGFVQKIRELISKNENLLTSHGSYEIHELSSLMNQVDCVIVPSIWWENSPMVIQEAFMHKRPVICSNIGGMAEKVEDGKTGLHFLARKSSDLAEKIKMITTNRTLLPFFVSNITPPVTVQECAAKHIELYKTTEKKKDFINTEEIIASAFKK